MFKNVTGQKLTVFAFDSTTNLPKTGDAANLTAYLDKDDGGINPLGDTSATEIDSTNAKGYYRFDVTQTESNADKILFTCKSSTANIVVIAVPAVVYTVPPNFTAFSLSAAGLVALIDDAITAAKIATGAIDADALAADAVGEIADGVWDEALAGHATAGSAGKALADAGAAGDPWATLLPGAYGAGTAGKIVGDNLDTNVGSRLPTAGYTAPPSAATIADAVWDEALAGHATAGSAGKALSDVLTGVNALDPDTIAAAVLDLADAIETGITLREATRGILASALGKLSGAATTEITIRNATDTKDRIVATVDSDGNREDVTLDLT